MLVTSTREFREKQGQFLGRVAKGEDLVLLSRKFGSFKIIPVTEDDTLMSKEDFFAKLEKSKREIKEGKGVVIRSKEELQAYFDSL
jgi:antitoxin (DNA-binding transcriptional repressor) of toxin-antitoxin stability system